MVSVDVTWAKAKAKDGRREGAQCPAHRTAQSLLPVPAGMDFDSGSTARGSGDGRERSVPLWLPLR